MPQKPHHHHNITRHNIIPFTHSVSANNSPSSQVQHEVVLGAQHPFSFAESSLSAGPLSLDLTFSASSTPSGRTDVKPIHASFL
jgi:hypothetical protein